MSVGSSDHSHPLVSVCMPVYNGGRFVEQAIRSVLAQTYPHFELLVFDDASTDGSWQILERIQDRRIVLHRNERNLGPEANWNRAIASAQGEYTKLFHQDDLLDPACLTRQVQALEDEPGASLTFCRRRIISPGGTQIMTRGVSWRDGTVVGGHEAFRRCVLAGSNLLGEPSAVLFRTNAARKVGSFDGSLPYLIDLNYWLRLLVEGSAVYLDAPLVSFRISPRQWSAAIGRRQGQDFVTFIHKISHSRLWRIGRMALCWGGSRARINGFLRTLLYRLLPKES